MRKPGYLIALLSFILLTGCARNSSEKDFYSETITLEDWMAGEIPSPQSDPEDSASLSDSLSEASMLAALDSALLTGAPEADSILEDAIAADEDRSVKIENSGTGRIKVRNLGRLADLFNDSNHFQLAHAERIGIAPITDVRSLYRTRRPLVKIETNKDFRVDNLTHSLPFLVPEAASLLHDIGSAFRDSVRTRKGGDYRIIVTSVLRTPSSVRRLTRVNRNAIARSTHQYATTFDITYARFEPTGNSDPTAAEDLKNILAEVIYNLRSQGRCLVKYERKSPCFHITATR